MTEEGLIFICDEAACKEDPFFYEIFPMDDRWAIIRAVLKAVQTAEASQVPPASRDTGTTEPSSQDRGSA